MAKAPGSLPLGRLSVQLLPELQRGWPETISLRGPRLIKIHLLFKKLISLSRGHLSSLLQRTLKSEPRSDLKPGWSVGHSQPCERLPWSCLGVGCYHPQHPGRPVPVGPVMGTMWRL